MNQTNYFDELYCKQYLMTCVQIYNLIEISYLAHISEMTKPVGPFCAEISVSVNHTHTHTHTHAHTHTHIYIYIYIYILLIQIWIKTMDLSVLWHHYDFLNLSCKILLYQCPINKEIVLISASKQFRSYRLIIFWRIIILFHFFS